MGVYKFQCLFTVDWNKALSTLPFNFHVAVRAIVIDVSKHAKAPKSHVAQVFCSRLIKVV